MSDLRKRVCIHYLKDAGKMILMALGIAAIILVENLILNYGDAEMIEDMIDSAIMTFGLFILLFNGIYAMYGPTWTDSLVLSMGVRRSDIFVGNILKEITFAVLGLIVLLLACFFTANYHFMFFSIYMCVASLVIAGIARIAGYKIKKFGKVALVVLVAVIATLSGIIGMSIALDGFAFDWFKFSVNTSVLAWGAFLIIYGILQDIVYRLNSKAMVH